MVELVSNHLEDFSRLKNAADLEGRAAELGIDVQSIGHVLSKPPLLDDGYWRWLRHANAGPCSPSEIGSLTKEYHLICDQAGLVVCMPFLALPRGGRQSPPPIGVALVAKRAHVTDDPIDTGQEADSASGHADDVPVHDERGRSVANRSPAPTQSPSDWIPVISSA